MDAARKIILRHYGGSKAEQTHEFPIEQEISIGRDPSCVIRYEADEDLVSRKHARIARDDKDPDRFLLTDLDSRNGTFINKRRISEPEVLRAGDVVQLGAGGPEFEFDLDPRPGGLTREYSGDMTAGAETRDVAYPRAGESSSPAAGGAFGSRTMEILSMARMQAQRNMRYVAAAAAAMVIVFGGGLAYQQHKMSAERREREAQRAEDMRALQALQGELAAQARASDEIHSKLDATMSSDAIAERYGPATIYIEAGWKLVETKTGQQLFHKYVGDGATPVYVQLPDGTVEPLLTTDPENNTNTAIGWGGHRGSGFVATNSGFILTNRHVAATWDSRYNLLEAGVLYTVEQAIACLHNSRNCGRGTPMKEGDVPQDWVPSKTKSYGGQSLGGKEITGRHDYLDVTFANSKVRIPARLVRTSVEHDVALLRVDVPEAVPTVQFNDDPGSVRVGQPVTVLGYPAISPDVAVRTESMDVFSQVPDIQVVPSPTATPGHIGRIIRGRGSIKPAGGEVSDYISRMGDVLQLTISETGQGNSGGPVFGEDGRVIAIFFAGGSDASGTAISFAVPIKYGLDLLKIGKVF
jgi:S1-C subfamily serine protease